VSGKWEFALARRRQEFRELWMRCSCIGADRFGEAGAAVIGSGNPRAFRSTNTFVTPQDAGGPFFAVSIKYA